MAARDFQPLKSLLPGVLARLTRGSGSARALGPVWEEAVGAVIARQARPWAWEGSRLVLRVTEARWLRELQHQGPQLLGRVQASLGAQAPTELLFRLAP